MHREAPARGDIREHAEDLKMINLNEVVETNLMIEKENLDVRTITLGISLLECMSDSVDTLCRKIYDRIAYTAKDLVKTGNEIERDYAIKVVNKRISVTPIGLVGSSCCRSTDDFVKIARTLDKVSEAVGVNFIGGYSALPVKGMTEEECLMAFGKPRSVQENNGEVQWMYSGSFYLFFRNGKVETIVR